MGEGFRQRLLHQSPWRRDEDEDELFDSDTFPSDSEEDDDAGLNQAASSPPKHSTPSSSSGPLYELSSLMEQLPIKRGLSNHYQGKSQSFTSLAEVSCLEDLPKKENPYKRRTMTPSKSYAAGLDATQKGGNGGGQIPGPCSKTMAKKAPRVSSCASLISSNGSGILHCSTKQPVPFPVHKNFCLH